MQLSQYPIIDFIRDVNGAVRKYSSESDVLRRIKALLENFLQDPNPMPPGAWETRHDRYAFNLIHAPKDKAFSIIGAVWQPGQTTPIHDHLTWAVVGVYNGAEAETLYRRRDKDSNGKYAMIEKITERVNKEGEAVILGRSAIHRVSNDSKTKTTLSIHIYGRDVGNAERHTYDPVTGEISAFVSGYCNVLRDLDRL